MTLSYTERAVSVAEADIYALGRARVEWTGTDEVKEAALRRGQDYIAGIGNHRWLDQWDNDNAPDLVKFAIIEAARRELVAPGSLTPDVVKSEQVVRERDKAGPLETETQFAEAKTTSDALPVIPAIDRLLAGLLRPSGAASVDLLRV